MAYTQCSSRWRRIAAVGAAFALIAVMSITFASPAGADGGEYKLDFTAAAPETYDHDTGGGAFNDRTVGVDKDIVESLEGGDFACLETVTYLTQIRRDTTDPDGPLETLELRYSFLADTTGQSGVAMTEVLRAQVNYGVVENGDPALGGLDSGIIDPDGASDAYFVQTDNGIPAFTKGAEIYATVQVDGIAPGDFIVLRVDVLLDCQDPRPTGNLQAQLNYTDVIEVSGSPGPLYQVTGRDRVPGGEQTVPFKQIRDIYPVTCPEQDFQYDGQDDSCNIGLPPAPGAEATSTESSGLSAIPLVGTVVDGVADNPEAGTMTVTGILLAAVALRRRRQGITESIFSPDRIDAS